jgi:hypothetical protein
MRLVTVVLGIAMMVISLAMTATGIAAGKAKVRPAGGAPGFGTETVEQCRARLMAAGTFQSHQRGYCVARARS